MAPRNYQQLVDLHNSFAASHGLRILAFPCNQFGGQEPGSEADIKLFADGYGVEFDMFSKINVNGSSAHPLYKFLKARLKGTFGNFIKWNFTKFLCDQDGTPVKRFAPTDDPLTIVPYMKPLWGDDGIGTIG